MYQPMTEDQFGDVLRRIVIVVAAMVAVCVGAFAGVFALGNNSIIIMALTGVIVVVIVYGAWRMFRLIGWVTKMPKKEET